MNLLSFLNNYSSNGLNKNINGNQISLLLNSNNNKDNNKENNNKKEKDNNSNFNYSILTYLNYLTYYNNYNENSIAIIDPYSERIPLKHQILKLFIENDFNLYQFHIQYKSRIGVLIPNGPELATVLISLVYKYCAAPINPNITANEIKIELESMKCKSIIVLSGFSNNSVILEVASILGITVISLHPSVTVTGIFSLELLQSSSTSTPSSSLNLNSQSSLQNSPSLSNNSNNNNNNNNNNNSNSDDNNNEINTKDDIVLLLHTSGTGGKKKLVPYTLEMLIIGVCCIISSWNLGPNDCCLNMMPLFHIGGIVRNIFSPILAGGSVITCNAFDPVLFWDILITKQFTWYYAAPTMHHAILLEASQRLASTNNSSSEKFNLKNIVKPVRFIANAAGGLLPALAESLKRVFQTTILTSYGMTECMPISTPPQNYDLNPPGTSGTPVGPSILIVADDMQTILPNNQTGHIMINGLPCFKGYETDSYTLDRDSFYTINGDINWFCTGDCGYLDEQGYLFISGRSKEIINRGGETISPFEIEEAVLSHPSIQEVMCFSSPHNHFQETVGAVIVIKNNFMRPDLPNLHKHLEKSLHRSKWPQILVYMNQLPKNNAGKLLRVKFSDRAKLPSIDDDMSPLDRLYEGNCPPIGTPLTTSIELKQIKIDLNELDQFLLNIPQIESVATSILDLPSKRDVIVAFITPSTINVNNIQELCEKSLPAYLCPFLIHSSDTLYDIPVLTDKDSDISQRNKEAIMKRALELFTSQSVILPTTDIEIELERIWREQLMYTRPLSINVSFFELGGDSLKAGALVSAIRKRFSIAITVADLFTSPTIQTLAQQLTYLLALEADSSFDSFNHHNFNDNNNIDSNNNSNNNNNDNNNNNNNIKKSNPTSPTSIKSLNGRFSPDTNELELGMNDLSNWEYSMKLNSTSWGCLFIQLLPLCFIFPIRRLSMWFLIAGPWVMLMNAGVDRFPALILAMLLMRFISGTIFPLIGILCKWMIIGEYKAGRYPLWGVMYLKWWLVEQILRITGRGIYRDDFPVIGTFLVRFYFTLMGASIGKNVKINRNAQIGQADLLAIGDNVVIDDATILPFTLEEGHMVLLPIVIGDRCSIGAKSTVASGSVLLSGTHIGPLSSSHEKDDALPQNLNYCRSSFPSPPWYYILFFGIPILTTVAMVSYVPWVIGLHMMVTDARITGWYDSEITSMYEAFLWWITPQRMIYYFVLRIIQRCVVPYVRLLVVIILKWSIIGRFTPLKLNGRKYSYNLFRYWLMSKLLPGGDLGGVSHLVGTHYEIISIIYRALGAKIGKRVYWPGSGLDIVEYDLLEVGDDVVFGSRSIIMTSTAERSDYVKLETGSMLADRCIVLPGSILKRGCVLGSGSLAPENFIGPIGSMWVGNKCGSATMVSSEDLSYEKKDLISPFGRSFYGNEANYCVIPLFLIVIYNTFWQGFCVCYHNCPILLSLFIAHYFAEFEATNLQLSFSLFRISILAFIPVFIFLSLFALLFDILMKWILIGRRTQGDYSWNISSYCQRWQLHLTLQQIRRGEREHTGILELICGSQYLVWYFQALGCNIGKNVCLYPNGGDPMMTEPDMVTIGDNCCIDNASLIAHINTRGIFKLNPVIVDNNCVLKSNSRLLSGSGMEEHSILLEHTLVISGEVVDKGSVWQGWPSQLHYPLREHRDGLTNLLSTKDLDLMSIFLSTNSASSMASMIRKKKRQHAEYAMANNRKNQSLASTSSITSGSSSKTSSSSISSSSISTQTFLDRFVTPRYQILKTDDSIGNSSHH